MNSTVYLSGTEIRVTIKDGRYCQETLCITLGFLVQQQLFTLAFDSFNYCGFFMCVCGVFFAKSLEFTSTCFTVIDFYCLGSGVVYICPFVITWRNSWHETWESKCEHNSYVLIFLISHRAYCLISRAYCLGLSSFWLQKPEILNLNRATIFLVKR